MPDTSAVISVPEGASKGKSLHDALSAAGYDKRLAALYDVIRFGPEFLSTQEFLALLFHVERSIPYNKTSDTASLGQMRRGVWSKKNNRWIRGGCGLSKRGSIYGNAGLTSKGLLKRTLRSSAKRGHEANEYEVQWGNLSTFFEARRVGKVFTPLVQDVHKGLVQDVHKPLCKTDTRNSNGSSSSVPKKKQGLSGFSGKVGSSGIPEQPQKPTQNPSFPLKTSDDDEKPSTPEAPRVAEEKPLSQRVKTQTPNPEETPEERFKRELIERHGTTVDVDKIIGLVRKESDHVLEQFPPDFPEWIAKETTGKVSKNVVGYYRSKAREFCRDRETARRKEELERKLRIQRILSPEPTEAVPEVEKCWECGNPIGKGAKIEDGRIVACPVCVPPCPKCDDGWIPGGPLYPRQESGYCDCWHGKIRRSNSKCKMCADTGYRAVRCNPEDIAIHPDGIEEVYCDCAEGQRREAEADARYGGKPILASPATAEAAA